MRALAIGLFVLVAVPGALAATHLVLLAIASTFYRAPDPGNRERRIKWLILIPAHNEAEAIGRTLTSIGEDLRDEGDVLVVADHCTDSTPDIARGHGAMVLVRGEDTVAGRGEARQAGLDHARTLDWDAVVMIDADCTIERGFFEHCGSALESAGVLQTCNRARSGPRLVDQVTVASIALQSFTIPRGREVLRCSPRLRGTGMVLTRSIAGRVRFRAPASEDLWLGLDLLLSGVRAHHVDRARISADNAPTWGAASTQKLRNEAGRMAAAREFVPALLRRRNWPCLEAAWYLLSPPFAIAVLSLLVGAIGGYVVDEAWLLIACCALLVGLALSFVVALAEVRASPRTWMAIVVAPWYLLWKVVVQMRAALSLFRREHYYPPTARESSRR